MNFAVFIPIIAMCCAAAIILTWMSNRHERAKWKLLGEEGGGRRELEAENAQLRATIERLEDRMAVLERIATDPAERTAREIEKLR